MNKAVATLLFYVFMFASLGAIWANNLPIAAHLLFTAFWAICFGLLFNEGAKEKK